MDALIINTMSLIDLNGERLAEFWVMTSDDRKAQPWIKVISMFGMHEIYRTNPSNPVALQAAMIMPMQSFLGYLMQLIVHSRKNPWAYELQSYSTYLTEPVSIKKLATLTQFPEEMVRTYFANHFVIKSDG